MDETGIRLGPGPILRAETVAMDLVEKVNDAAVTGFEVKDEYGNMHWAISEQQIEDLCECAGLLAYLAEIERSRIGRLYGPPEAAVREGSTLAEAKR